MKEFKAIMDTWTLIEKHGLKDWRSTDHDTVEISEQDYNKLISDGVRKEYIAVLLAGSGSFCTHGYTR